jgi:hypothetical protein
MALVSPQKEHLQHPLLELRRAWQKATKVERETFDLAPWKEEFACFLDVLCNSGPCTSLHNPGRQINCNCMSELDFVDDNEQDAIFSYLCRYARMTRTEQRVLILEWKRYAAGFQASCRGNKNQVYLLPGSSTYKICKSALAKLIGKERYAWDSIKEGGQIEHGLSKQEAGNRAQDSDMTERLHEYFKHLQALGAPRATRLVTDLCDGVVTTELKDADTELVELPACHSKRALYRSFNEEIGWAVTFDNKSRMTSQTEAVNTVGNTEGPISWPSFCRFWKKYYPKIVIQRPAEDLCDDCVIFANRHKYGKRQAQEEDDDVVPPTKSPDFDTLNKETEEQEELVLEAAKHVKMAQSQRLLFVNKKREALMMADEPLNRRTLTFVCDFAQNMYVPNFAAEQPGATYYYSPLNVYPFGIVDCSCEPSQLIAFMFAEGEGKKGGNTVASMLWKFLKLKKITSETPAQEINFVFDNCTGQNKNRMVTRFLFFLVKLRVCNVARAIFLVKGHTKNDCDRMFNLMKYDYRKVNCFTPTDLLSIVNRHPQVTAIPMKSSDFLDWDKLENKMVAKADGILKNHIFTVKSKDSNRIMVQEYDGAPITRQLLVKPAFQSVDWKLEMNLDVIPPPGLPDIKWNELYYKWGRFVPEDKKQGLVYFCNEPPASIKKKIAEQTAEAKQARGKRTRTNRGAENDTKKKQAK